MLGMRQKCKSPISSVGLVWRLTWIVPARASERVKHSPFHRNAVSGTFLCDADLMDATARSVSKRPSRDEFEFRTGELVQVRAYARRKDVAGTQVRICGEENSFSLLKR